MFMPKEAGVRLQTDVAGLRQELGRLRAAQEQQNAARLEHDQASDAQLNRVQKRLDEASKVSHLAEADMGTQLDRVLEDVQRLRGSLEEHDHRLSESEAKLDQKLNERLEGLKKAAEQRDAASKAAKKALPRGKKDQLAYARRALAEGRGDEGRSVLRELASRYGKERGIGDEALFTLASDAYAAGRPELALRDFVRLLDAVPTSPRAAEATFRVGQCAQATGRMDDARTFYHEVSTAYPRSSWAAQAKAQLVALPAVGDKAVGRPGTRSPAPPTAAPSPARSGAVGAAAEGNAPTP